MYLVEDVDGLAEYNWASIVWQFLVDALDETKVKLRTTKNVQINGFAMLLQVCHYHCTRPAISFPSMMVSSFKCCKIWLYKYCSKFDKANTSVPRICRWANLYGGKKYDARVLLAGMKDNEACDVINLFLFIII